MKGGVWFEIPKYQFNESKYKYTIIQDENILDTGILEDCNSSHDLLFECPIPIGLDVFGDIEIHIKSNLDNSFVSFISIYDNSSLWSSDINVVLGVMSYILSYSEIKTLYDLKEEDQVTFVSDYLDSKDPDPTTEINEFLEIIKTRFEYVNDNFSKHDIGWRTDRGEIYIIYGPPYSVDSYYDNKRMINFEKWYYNDKEFIFSDERSFGEMQLIRQF